MYSPPGTATLPWWRGLDALMILGDMLSGTLVGSLKPLTSHLIFFLFLPSQCTPQNAQWAKSQDTTIWIHHTGRTRDSSLASPPPSQQRKTKPQASAQKWLVAKVEQHLPTPNTTTGVTQVTALLPGDMSSTPAAGHSQSIACTPRTSPHPTAKKTEDISKE